MFEYRYTHYMQINYFTLCCVLLCTIDSFGRRINSFDWYKSDQTYLKISVTETGWYHCAAEQLQLHEFPLLQDSLDYLQLFRRGEEIAISVNTDISGKFSSLEFYGKRNDGMLDSSLYVQSSFQPQNLLSLYSDTAAYFLTYGRETGKRIKLQENRPTSLEHSPHYLVKHSHVYTNEYSAGNIYPLGATYENGVILPTYDEGEGYCGKLVSGTDWEKIILSCQSPAKTRFDNSVARLTFIGRKAGKHRIELMLVNSESPMRKVGELAWENFQKAEIELSFPQEDLSDKDEIILLWKPVTVNDAVSIVSTEWIYPRSVEYLYELNESNHTFQLPVGPAYLPHDIPNIQYIDVRDPTDCKRINGGSQWIEAEAEILVMTKPLIIHTMQIARFCVNPLPETEYLIITHPILRQDENGEDPVSQYATYRNSPEGGGYKVLVMNIEEVFNHFSYGERSPEAIRQMILYMTTHGKLQFVYLIGRSRDPQTVRFANNGWKDDLIPNAGWPGSDMALAMRTHTDPVPVVAIGRLFVSKAEEVKDYLAKVKLLESESKVAGWRKNILHMSGGTSPAEREIFRSYTESFEDMLTEANTGMHVESMMKSTDKHTEKIDISAQINRGIALVTTFGHSSLEHVDLDFGKASAPESGLQNSPKFPAFWVNGCAIGNMYFRQLPLSTDWVNVAGKGALLFVAHSHNGATPGLKRYTDALYETLADERYISLPFGSIMKEAASRYLRKFPWLTDIITVQQMNLQGDPAIRIFPASLPDLQWEHETISVGSKQDGLVVNSTVLNAGRYWKGDYTAKLQIVQDGVELFQERLRNVAIPAKDSIRFFIPVQILKNLDPIQVILQLDPDELLSEEVETNNSFTFSISPADYLPFMVTEFTASPNPFATEVIFNLHIFGEHKPLISKIEFYDVQGNRVDEIIPVLQTGFNEIRWVPIGIAPGTYVYKFKIQDRYERSGKLIYRP